jgi:hypothetical protein
MQRNGLPLRAFTPGFLTWLLLTAFSTGWCQQAQPQPADSDTVALTAAVHELQAQVQELRAAVAEVRSQAAEYREQTDELRRELALTRQSAAPAPQMNAPAVSVAASATAQEKSSLADRVSSLEETTSLLNNKVNEEAQTRVESGSKYHVRLSGLVLMNLFNNRGTTDNADLPSFALAPSSALPGGNFGATIRQSEIGLEVFGPQFAGARVSGNLTADFTGGFPNTWNGVNSGLFRMLTANIRMDWENTSVVAGQDSLFVSPLSPTSFASVAIPTFNYAGNLWSWTPQVRIEHKIHLGDDQEVLIQGGILDNLTGDFPSSSFDRVPQGGERSGQPAYAARTAWTTNLFGSPMTLGAAGYYSRQNWQFGRTVDGWAGMADWNIPIGPLFSLSGEFYSGRAIGGINAGIGRSVLYNGNPTLNTTVAYGLHSRGGWSQLKLKATPKLEFNAAFGLDNPDASEAREFSAGSVYIGPALVRNVGSLGNVIYRPRSNLILSAEYKHLETASAVGNSYPANQLNMIMGILF